MPYVVYGLVDPESSRIRFVGFSEDPAQRMYHHLHSRTSSAESLWIQDLATRNIQPRLQILKTFETRAEASGYKRYLIGSAAYQSLPPLLNTGANLLPTEVERRVLLALRHFQDTSALATEYEGVVAQILTLLSRNE